MKKRRQGIESDDEEEEVEEGSEVQGAVAPGDIPSSGSSSEGETDSDEESNKPKGVEHLIEIQNPNRLKGRSSKKVTELQDGKAELTRRGREEIEKQQAKANYQKMHMAGKTDEARADLARLAIIRKQREEAQRRGKQKKLKKKKLPNKNHDTQT